jgi:putative ABC transport system ATP-binding protein
MTQRPVIELMGVTRRYDRNGHRVVALDDVDVSVSTGEFVSVVGRSGSGKTTLLAIMGLLDRPDAGAVLLDGEDLQHLSASRLAGRRRRNIGYLFQDAGLVSRMRVFDSVCMPLRYAGLKRSSVDAQARAALEAVDLGAMATRRVEALSGGERQRVGLARALASRPRLLVCDEPSAALDETTTRVVGRLLRAYADEGGAVVVATHDPLLMPLADKTVRFDRGCATSTR